MIVTPETTVAEIASRYPATTRVFERYQIDFCCGGDRRLEEVCRERDVPYAQLVADLEAATRRGAGQGRDWTAAPLAELIEWVLTAYHAPLREELPRIERLAEKVRRVHGERFPDLVRPLVELVARLKGELETHMQKEEVALFPAIVAFEQAHRQGWPAAAAVSFEAPIAVMRHEHDEAGRALSELRRLTHEYTLPEGACATFAALYHGLGELEQTLHEHIHLENNILFPRALALAGERS
jgi:regulator of cell morphogenesis and NO signaling